MRLCPGKECLDQILYLLGYVPFQHGIATNRTNSNRGNACDRYNNTMSTKYLRCYPIFFNIVRAD